MSKAFDDVVDVDAAIPELALAGDALAVNDFETVGTGDIGQPDHQPVALFVSKPLIDLVGLVGFHRDSVPSNHS